MSTVGHVVLGAAFARFAEDRAQPLPRWWLVPAMIVLAFLPDLDILVPFVAAVDPLGPWGHRGASHSIGAAVVVGLLAWPLLRGRGGWRLAAICAANVASHGLADALTDVDLGVMLFWPLSEARIVAPFHPIPITPVGPSFLSPAGALDLVLELLWFAPAWLYTLWPRRA